MCKLVSLAAVSPVANGLNVVLMNAECPRSATELVAAKPVTSCQDNETGLKYAEWCGVDEIWLRLE